MNTVMRPVVIGFGMGFLAVCVFGLRFACPEQDFREADRGAELKRLEQATQDRMEARRRMVREVIAGRRSLAEAIERFLELYRQWPDYSLAAAEAKAGTTEDEWAYQYILRIVEDILHDRPEQASAVLRRLEQEYEKPRIGRQARSTAATVQTEQGHSTPERGGR